MGKTTNILDLNNRLEKVEKESVAQNNYNSLKNRPKINGNLLTGDKTGAQLGLAEAQDIGDLSVLTTTDKTSCVGAINELKSSLTNVETLQTLEPDALSNGNITIKQNCGVKFVICHNMVLKNPLPAGESLELCAAGTVLNPPTENTIFSIDSKTSGKNIAPVNLQLRSDGGINVINFTSTQTLLYGYCTGAYI